MSGDDEAIGLVRVHRWATLDIQTKRLREDGCRAIIDLGSTKREEVLRLLRDGRTGKLLYAFLLVDPKRKRKLFEDFRAVLAKIEARDGIIKDVFTGLDNTDKARRAALLDVVRGQARRHLQGTKWAEEPMRHKPGRKPEEFTAEQIAAAKAIWRDRIEYPTWKATDDALEQIMSANDEPFKRSRAHRLWGPRQPKRKKP
jgi:hypothetical protein